MRYLSVCSGIEAASVAWEPLGWQPVAFSEIEAFPCALLAYRYPTVPNWGDMTRFADWPDAAINVLVGGTPCQSFSVAGLRKGLADPRGNLALTFLGIADRYRPEWILWENVPGVLSTDGGRAFGSILGGMAELGYHPSYRTIDAQYVRVDGFGRAVPQRRRRVFVVGHFRDWRRAAAVLFEPESLSGNSPPRRETRKGTGPAIIKGAAIGRQPENGPQYGEILTDGSCFTLNCTETHAVSAPLLAKGNISWDDSKETYVTGEVSFTLNAHPNRTDGESETFVAFGHQASASQSMNPDTVTPSLDKSKTIAVAYDNRGRDGGAQFEGPHDTANMRASNGGSSRSYVASSWAVRRLTPTECERLQGYPDGYTAIPFRGKPATDSPRYKALGNSMAINCMRWLGRRIEMVSAL